MAGQQSTDVCDQGVASTHDATGLLLVLVKHQWQEWTGGRPLPCTLVKPGRCTTPLLRSSGGLLAATDAVTAAVTAVLLKYCC